MQKYFLFLFNELIFMRTSHFTQPQLAINVTRGSDWTDLLWRHKNGITKAMALMLHITYWH